MTGGTQHSWEAGAQDLGVEVGAEVGVWTRPHGRIHPCFWPGRGSGAEGGAGGLAGSGGWAQRSSLPTCSIHNGVIAVFQRKGLPDQELFSLNEGVR